MVLILIEQSACLSVNFNGQFEDGLFISDSLCTDAPHPPNNPTSEKIGEGVSVG